MTVFDNSVAFISSGVICVDFLAASALIMFDFLHLIVILVGVPSLIVFHLDVVPLVFSPWLLSLWLVLL